jgi:hypothetical protein
MFAIKKLAVAVIIIISLEFFPTAFRTVNYNSSFADIITPNSGLYVLPPKVRAGIRLLQEQRLTSFRISPAMNRYSEIQRLIEGAYPIRVLEKSAYCLMFSNEQVPSGCAVISGTEEVTLVYCP